MIDGASVGKRVGVCLDTCHAFAAGYAIHTRSGFKDFRKQIDDLLPTGCVAALHLNDSQKPLGSRVDRHEHIGRGEIGLEAFRMLLADPVLGKLPGYLETKKGIDEASGEAWDVINLRTLRELAR
jgi:deoxyribonuclease-4